MSCCARRCLDIKINRTKNLHKILFKIFNKLLQNTWNSEDSWGKQSIYKWYNLFQDGRKDVNDELRSTTTTTENVEGVKKIVLVNRQITIREFAEDIGISVGSCRILGMGRVSSKFVPKLLNFDQNNLRISIAEEILICSKGSLLVTNHGCMVMTSKPMELHYI